VTLYLRNALRLKRLESDRVLLVEGDVLDTKKLAKAMAGKEDVVRANLAGDLVPMATSVVTAMHKSGVRRPSGSAPWGSTARCRASGRPRLHHSAARLVHEHGR
jgi:putative NAD(P)-binding protein